MQKHKAGIAILCLADVNFFVPFYNQHKFLKENYYVQKFDFFSFFHFSAELGG